MKESPEQKRLQDALRPGKLSSEGFLGADTRTAQQIIEDDARILSRLGVAASEVAARMQALTDLGLADLGRSVLFAQHLEITVSEAMGSIPCPFGDRARAAKRLTRVQDIASGNSVSWSDLNIHMISQHGFFEGRGAYFRIEPEALWAVIGPASGIAK